MNNERTTVTVDFDGRQATEQLKSLGTEYSKLRKETEKAYAANDHESVAKGEMAMGKLQSRMKSLRKESKDITGVLNNLSGSSLPELIAAEKKLQTMLNPKKIKRNSTEWNKITSELRLVTTEKKNLRAEMRGMDKNLSSSNNKIKDLVKSLVMWGGGMALAQKAGQGIINILRSSVKAYDEFEVGSKKLSSLTKLQGKDLEWLQEQAKQTSVATIENGIRVKQSANDILDAYTLIGSQKPELLKNKEALHEVTKEAIILSEAASMQLEPAAAALTNSLNQFNTGAKDSRRYINALAAGSQAGAGNIEYLSKAVENSGTTASMMNLEFEDLIALIETAAPKFSDASQAGNSLDKVMMKMQAKQIGYKDGVFDMNKALEELSIRFNKGEMASQIFGEEHAKMVKVLVQGKDEFNRYKNAVTDTEVALEQAATNTDTRTAKRQQRLNQLQLIRIELGEKLLPLVGTFTGAGISLLKVTSSILDFLYQYKFSIASLITSRVLYKSIKIAHLLLDKQILLTGKENILQMVAKRIATQAQILLSGKASMAQKRVLVATKATNMAMKSTPWGLIASLAVSAGMAIYEYVKNSDKLSESQQRLVDIEKRHNEELGNQTGKMAALFAQIKKTNPGTEKRIELVDKLATAFPDLIDKQKLYKSGLKDLETAERNYSKALEEKIRLKINEDKFAAVVSEQMKKEEEILAKEVETAKIRKEISELTAKGGFFNELKAGDLRNDSIQTGLAISKLKNEIIELGKQKEDINFNINSTTTKKENNSTSGYAPMLTITEFDEKAYDDAIEKQIIKELDAEEKRIKANKKASEKIKEYRESVLRNSLSAVNKENAAFNDRLKKAGLFGKKKKKFTAQDHKILEALEKEHQAKIDKIDSDAITKYLSEKKKTQEGELQDLHIKQAEELAVFEGTAEEKKALQTKQQEDEKELLSSHLTELITLGQKLLSDGQLEGLSLSDSILSDEEKKELKEKLNELKEEKAKLTGKANTEESSTKIDVLGMSQDDWDSFQTNLENGKFGIEELQASVKILSSVFSMYDKIQSAAENKSLKKYQKNTSKKKKALEGQLKSGKISKEKYNSSIEALDHQLDAKKAEIEQKQAKRQKAIAIVDTIINTAVGVAAALKVAPPLGFVLAGITAGMGAAQLALIASQPLPGKEKGGHLVTREDGKQYQASVEPDKRGYISKPTVIVGESGDEFVMNNDTVKNPTIKPLIDTIDMAQKNGTVASLNLPAVLSSQNNVKGRETGGFLDNEGSIPPLPSSQSEASSSSYDEILAALNLLTRVVQNKKLELPWYGRGGIAEKMKQAKVYESKTKF
jgi:TP901 family phage tail tape measure protein